MRYFVLILLLTLLPSCWRSKEFKADSNLLQDFTREKRNNYHIKPPYYAHYKKNNKELIFIAAKHRVDPKSKTFLLIKDAFQKYRPDILIFEGFPTTENPSPKKYFNYATKCWKQEKHQKCSEPSYGVFLAIKKETPFLGGEPPNLNILKFIESQNYNAKDLLAFYAIRMIPQWKKRGQIHKNFSKTMEKLIQRTAKYKLEKPTLTLSYSDLTSWYQKKMGQVLNKKNISSQDFAPLNTPQATYLQKFSYSISKARDRHLVQLIAKTMNQYQRTLVIYGSGHLLKQRKVLEKMLGKPLRESQKF